MFLICFLHLRPLSENFSDFRKNYWQASHTCSLRVQREIMREIKPLEKKLLFLAFSDSKTKIFRLLVDKLRHVRKRSILRLQSNHLKFFWSIFSFFHRFGLLIGLVWTFSGKFPARLARLQSLCPEKSFEWKSIWKNFIVFFQLQTVNKKSPIIGEILRHDCQNHNPHVRKITLERNKFRGRKHHYKYHFGDSERELFWNLSTFLLYCC